MAMCFCNCNNTHSLLVGQNLLIVQKMPRVWGGGGGGFVLFVIAVELVDKSICWSICLWAYHSISI